jgi:hypothetical protein
MGIIFIYNGGSIVGDIDILMKFQISTLALPNRLLQDHLLLLTLLLILPQLLRVLMKALAYLMIAVRVRLTMIAIMVKKSLKAAMGEAVMDYLVLLLEDYLELYYQNLMMVLM